jgi:hypothetical protein
MTRRQFLKIAGWCAAPLTVVAVASRNSAARAVNRIGERLLALVQSPDERLRSHFSYLTLDNAGVEQFFTDHRRFRGDLPRHARLPSDAYTRYLLSTDFFRHRADESQIVRYVGFYDPDNTPCGNPLAEFDNEV